MNHLQTYVGGTMEQCDAGVSGVRREHMNNFNRGDNQDVVYWDKKPQTDDYKIVGAMLMVNSGTADFSYNGTEDSQYHNTYVIIPGEQIDRSLAGYWYVGFDFFENGQNGNMQVDRDWQFNDWIVRISPAQRIGSPDEDWEIIEGEEFIEGGRIFCEDLGASSLNDVDYNDIVFDAIIVRDYRKLVTKKNGQIISETYQFTKNGLSGYDTHYAKVCLLAAGGTIPATVEGKEVHNVLGGTSTVVMINTTEDRAVVKGASIATHDPVVIDEYFYGIDNLDDITIDVRYGNSVTELTAPEGAVPLKICVPIGTRWAKERVMISDAYKSFTAYNADPTVKFWEGEVDEEGVWNIDNNEAGHKASPFEIYKNYTEGTELRYEVVDSGTGTVSGGSGNGSGSELWSGNESLDWSQKIVIEKEKFANATSSSSIRFHCTAGNDYKQIWLKTLGWNVIAQPYASNDWNGDYYDFPIGGCLSTLQNNDVSVQGWGLTCTYIELIP